MPVPPTPQGLTCRIEDRPPADGDGVLAVVSRGRRSAAPVLRDGVPALRVAVPEAGPTGRVEVWRTGRSVTSGQDDDGLVHAHDGQYLFCAARIRHDEDYDVATEKTYLRILDLAAGEGYPDVARMWNVVGGITAPVADGSDRYREFCRARGRAFGERGLGAGAAMPAATGIGGQDGFTTVHLLATRSPVVRIENPLQVPAFEYPPRYGVQPPSFARAAWVRTGDRSGDLFVSGTASIRGHLTVHHGDVERQTRATLDTVAELVSGANLRAHGVDADVALRDLDAVTVYVKHPDDVPAVRRICAAALGAGSRVVHTVADVCRDDLLVEIEAFTAVRSR